MNRPRRANTIFIGCKCTNCTFFQQFFRKISQSVVTDYCEFQNHIQPTFPMQQQFRRRYSQKRQHWLTQKHYEPISNNQRLNAGLGGCPTPAYKRQNIEFPSSRVVINSSENNPLPTLAHFQDNAKQEKTTSPNGDGGGDRSKFCRSRCSISESDDEL